MPRNVLVGISPTDPVTLAAVVAGLVLVTLITTRRVVHYDEPRYRAGLWLNVGDGPSPAAIGGVLAGWQGRPPGVEAAHVRFFLEPWATVRSGQVIDFDRLSALFRPAL